MNRLFLLDGMALIYRAHFAFMRNPITNSKGLNTSAIFGFTNTLFSILESEKPTHLGVALDTSAPTERHRIFPEYKAQRDAMPEELAAAIPFIKEICESLHIPLIIKDGFEADDLIGAIAHQADQTKEFTSYLVTPDKDFAQLVSDHTAIWKPGRAGTEHEVLTKDDILSLWGIEHPKQVIDILALWGDASDNIPGVPGIGEKTAKKLIAQYGSVEELLAHSSELKGKQKENVESSQELARLCKKLTTIITSIPDLPALDDFQLTLPSGEQLEAAQTLFQELEFKTLLKRLLNITQSAHSLNHSPKTSDPPPPSTLKKIEDLNVSYHLYDTVEKQLNFLKRLAQEEAFCFDLETTSLNRFRARILGIAFSFKSGEAHYLPYLQETHEVPSSTRPSLPFPPEIQSELQRIFSNQARKIGHNLKYDLHVLLHHGLPVQGPFFDTMLAHALLEPDQRHSMDSLAESLLSYQTIKLSDLVKEHEVPPEQDDLFSIAQKKKRSKSKDLDLSEIPLPALAQYASEDADITWQLYQKLIPQLKERNQHLVAEEIEFPLLPALVQMEAHGVTVDLSALAKLNDQLTDSLDQLTQEVYQITGEEFNLNSPKQLGEILFVKMQLVNKPKKTKTGQFKTDEKTLQSLAQEHPVIQKILSYRELSKLKSTYIEALPGHIEPHSQRIHTEFHQVLTATGRLASSHPNLQNIPIRSSLGKEIRATFIPQTPSPPSTPSSLLAADYSQIELRIMAALSGDPALIEAFQNGEDVHTSTAARIFNTSLSSVQSEQRRIAKMVNFGIIYGISAFGLAQRLTISRHEASEIIDTYLDRYQGVQSFMNETIAFAREQGYVETLSGRRRYLPQILSSNKMMAQNAERAAINAPIQGTAADLIKIAMTRVHDLLSQERNQNGSPYQSTMILQVHDELLFNLHPDDDNSLPSKIVTTMETALLLPHQICPKVDIGIGHNWLKAH